MQVGRTRNKADKGVPGPRRLDSPELPALRNLYEYVEPTRVLHCQGV